MLIAMVLAGSMFSAAPTAADVNPKMKAYLDYMALSFACDGADSVEYKSARNSAERGLMTFQPATTYTANDITGLDRGLKSGAVKPPAIDAGDCENLLMEAKSALP